MRKVTQNSNNIIMEMLKRTISKGVKMNNSKSAN